MPETKKVSLSLPHWIGDYNTLGFHNAGAPIDWAAFTDAKFGAVGKRRIPSGTVVQLVGGKIRPGVTAGQQAYLLYADTPEDVPALGASGHGLVTGGNVREAWLPDASGAPRTLTAEQKTALGVRFYFQS